MKTATQLNSLITAFDDLFYGGLDSFMEDFFSPSTNAVRQMYPISFPPCNVYIDEETKDLKLEFAIAGIPKEQISMDLDGDYLYLSIEKPKEEEEEEGRFTLVQKGIKRASTEQKFYIPSSKYETSGSSAIIKDGILTVEIPAKKEMAKKRLKISAS